MNKPTVPPIPRIAFKFGTKLIEPIAVLGGILVVLKAIDAIKIPWWLVLLPFYWLPALMFLVLAVAVLTFVVVCLIWFVAVCVNEYQSIS